MTFINAQVKEQNIEVLKGYESIKQIVSVCHRSCDDAASEIQKLDLKFSNACQALEDSIKQGFKDI